MDVSLISCDLRVFQKLDYTLMNDNYIEKPGVDIVFALPLDPNLDAKWDDSWGGLMHYVCDTETLLSIAPMHNTLHITERDRDTMRFVKLVNQAAKYARCEYNLVFESS